MNGSLVRSLIYLRGMAISSAAVTVFAANTAATLTTALTGSNNDLKYTAAATGSQGNYITVAYIDPLANNAVLAVSVSGYAITVSLATDGGGAITSLASDIVTAVGASVAATALVTVANASANDGTGAVTALAATHLSGGGDAPTKVVSADGDGTGQVYVKNVGSNPVYLGGPGVTTSTGYTLANGSEMTNPIELSPGSDLYAAVAANTESVRVLIVG
jgi:hypothetical protein